MEGPGWSSAHHPVRCPLRAPRLRPGPGGRPARPLCWVPRMPGPPPDRVAEGSLACPSCFSFRLLKLTVTLVDGPCLRGAARACAQTGLRGHLPPRAGSACSSPPRLSAQQFHFNIYFCAASTRYKLLRRPSAWPVPRPHHRLIYCCTSPL